MLSLSDGYQTSIGPALACLAAHHAANGYELLLLGTRGSRRHMANFRSSSHPIANISAGDGCGRSSITTTSRARGLLDRPWLACTPSAVASAIPTASANSPPTSSGTVDDESPVSRHHAGFVA